MQLPNYSIIQKSYYSQSVDFTMAGFVDALMPDKFTDMHFKRCQVKVCLWLIVLHTWEARLVILVCHTLQGRRDRVQFPSEVLFR